MAETEEKVMLEITPEWNAVPDLIREDEDELIIRETDIKRKRDEVARGVQETAEGRLCPPGET